MQEQTTPLYVIKALAQVQESGRINMLDREGVTAMVASDRAADWLDSVGDSQYMEALNDMGEYISVPNGTDEETPPGDESTF